MNTFVYVRIFLFMYVVASKYSRNHFISEKNKRVQSFKIYFLQNSPFLHLHTSASDCEGVVNIPESRVVRDFSAVPSHY